MADAAVREIVDLLMQGMSNRQIAHSLGIAEATVKKHLHHVYRKFGVRSRALLIARPSCLQRKPPRSGARALLPRLVAGRER